MSPKPPIAPRKPVIRTLHGRRRIDDYAWLRDENWQQVMRDPTVLQTDIRAHLRRRERLDGNGHGTRRSASCDALR